jgi:type IV secretory pathway component VirB8
MAAGHIGKRVELFFMLMIVFETVYSILLFIILLPLQLVVIYFRIFFATDPFELVYAAQDQSINHNLAHLSDLKLLLFIDFTTNSQILCMWSR